MKFAVSLLLSLCVSGALSAGPFTATITNKPVFKLGDEVIVEVTLTNNHPVDYFILKRFTPLEGLRANIFTVTTNKGSVLPYDGLMFRRGPTQKDEYNKIRANSSISLTATLSNAYGFYEAGTYLVKLSTTLTFASSLDVGPVTQLLVSNTNRLMLTVGDKQPHLTIGETNRRKDVKQKVVDFSVFNTKAMKNPKFGGTWTDVMKKDATNVYTKAFQVMLNATDLAVFNTNRYTTWFGTINYSGYVKSVLQDCTNDMQVYSFTLYNGLSVQSACGPYDYAYRFDGTLYIVLCKVYYTSGFEDKYETIVHEMTHASARTEDYEYGRTGCKKLAIDNPAKAVNNADNYAYFTDNL
ncbi:LOW QUALITY PROTEIN: extracellular protease-like [Halichondria panicea]|uniref:LOW QUALITY PROTEIN: extracellular protease-like n=1 Tax=Halichondria panicea TaxID=6063 RepID=UPI00312BAE10